MSSKPATKIGLYIGQHLPPWIGYGVARFVANYACRKRPENYWKVRANLRQVVGPQVDDATLHEMVRRVFFHAGQAYYDFYHASGLASEELAGVVRVPAALFDLIRAQTEQGRGTLVLGLHISNFDLAMVAVGAYGIRGLGLSLANPGPGFQMQNRLRTRAGIEVTPISPESLRLAVQRLKSGGAVFTGADRPVPGEPATTEFFGRPAYLSLGMVRLALMTGATVLVISCYSDPGVGCAVRFTGPVEMIRTEDRQQDVLSNARRLAMVFEDHIRDHPDQWLMFHRVWPELEPGSAP